MSAPEGRPRLVVVVTGTGTEVGKTWVTCALARALRASGWSVSARKPAQSFAPGTPAEATDAHLLAVATGETAYTVCPPHRWYARAMAPPMAAASMGLRAPRLSELVSETVWPAPCDFGLVELAGGVGSPQAADGDGADFVRASGPGAVVLVGEPGLGTLNDVRLAARALGPQPGLAVVLNRYDEGDELHRRNRAWLENNDGLAVFVDLSRLARRLGQLAVS